MLSLTRVFEVSSLANLLSTSSASPCPCKCVNFSAVPPKSVSLAFLFQAQPRAIQHCPHCQHPDPALPLGLPLMGHPLMRHPGRPGVRGRQLSQRPRQLAARYNATTGATSVATKLFGTVPSHGAVTLPHHSPLPYLWMINQW